MSGKAAVRGFLLQTIICLLESLREGEPWQTVTLEPDLASTKVDIIWRYSDKVRAWQIKSSQNQIGKAHVVKWAREEEESKIADEYTLFLIGPCAKSVVEMKRAGKVLVPTPESLNIDGLIERTAHRLDIYLESKGIGQISPCIRERIALALVAKLEIYSANGVEVTRNEMEQILHSWIIDSYPRTAYRFGKEVDELREFKKLFKFETKRDLRDAIMNFYESSSHKIRAETIRETRDFLTVKDGVLAVHIPKIDFAFGILCVALGILILGDGIFLHILNIIYEHDGNSSIAGRGFVLFISISTIFIGAFAVMTSMPILQAMHLRKVLQSTTLYSSTSSIQ